MTPTDMLKQRRQLCSKNEGILTLIKNTYESSGVRAFYKSLPIQIAMNLPFMSTFMFTNEKLRLL